jgi:hypothetical protein
MSHKMQQRGHCDYYIDDTFLVEIVTLNFNLIFSTCSFLIKHVNTRYLYEYTVDPRTSNGLMFEKLETRTKKFEENPVLKLEQKLESRTKNRHVVAFSLSAWSRWKKGNSPSSEQ